ncbi:MAG: hypothetical protein PVG98_11555 [Chromatiales bacterium]|jgi:hypothetical protein
MPEFPEARTVVGFRMSDAELYAVPLSRKLNYTNTFYHQEPMLNIASLFEDMV